MFNPKRRRPGEAGRSTRARAVLRLGGAGILDPVSGGEQDRAAVRLPPPLVLVTAVAAGIALDRWVVALSLDFVGALRRPLAGAVFLAATGLAIAALALFRRTGQNPEPWKSTPELIPVGVYRFTRNPMYLGLALFQAAAGLWMSNGWLLVLVPLTLLGLHHVAVRHEEAYLERKFGDSYREYKASVRRWL